MKIEFQKITIGDLAEGYVDNAEKGVRGYGGRLDIRPPYQREFVYKAEQRDAVVDTVINGFPLNVMYWSVRDDGNFEIIDGQQRTISVCQYVNSKFSYNKKYFHNLQDDEQKSILDYELMIYLCSGTDSERLEWFKIVNIAGVKLTPQELRNAVYSGSWLSDAKRHFSKKGCAAYNLASDYVSGSAIRQEYLEMAIRWISKDDIEEYMAKHQDDQDAAALWHHFKSVIDWVGATFKKKRSKLMRHVDWGPLYDEHKDESFDADQIEVETQKLINDEDVTHESGIYQYILTRDEKYLSIRKFSDGVKQKVYELQNGRCKKCGKGFALSKMEADHITPWSESGKTKEENCQILCRECNRRKSAK